MIKKSSLCMGFPKTLVFLRQNFVPLGKGILLERGVKKRCPPRNRYFIAIDSSAVKTVAERHRLAAYHISLISTANELSMCRNIDDLERTPQNGVWVLANF